jgi:hypothetical protein
MAVHIHEHLHNTVMVLISSGVISNDSSTSDNLTSLTWDTASKIGVSPESLAEWKTRAAADVEKNLENEEKASPEES